MQAISHLDALRFHSTKEVSKVNWAKKQYQTIHSFHSTKEVSKGGGKDGHGKDSREVSIPLRKFRLLAILSG